MKEDKEVLKKRVGAIERYKGPGAWGSRGGRNINKINYYANAIGKHIFEKASSSGMRNSYKCRKKMRQYKN